jgi:hypothetical protein
MLAELDGASPERQEQLKRKLQKVLGEDMYRVAMKLPAAGTEPSTAPAHDDDAAAPVGGPSISGEADTAEPTTSRSVGDNAVKHKKRKHHHQAVADSNAAAKVAPVAASDHKVRCCWLIVKLTMPGDALPSGHGTNKHDPCRTPAKWRSPTPGTRKWRTSRTHRATA